MSLAGPLAEKPQAKDVLRAAAEVLDGLGVKWWLSAGTALGFHRDGGFIAHDTDIDVGVEGLDPNLVKAFLDAGFVEYRFDQDFQRAFSKNDVIFDIYIFQKEGSKMVSKTAVGRIVKPYKLFTHLDLLLFDNKLYPVPSPIERYLEVRFGKTWRIPQTSKGNWMDDAACLEINYANK